VQNIALALGVKVVFLTLTLMGYGTMWMAVFADAGASLLVVGNGLRLLRYQTAGSGPLKSDFAAGAGDVPGPLRSSTH
jgi:cation transport ATPase